MARVTHASTTRQAGWSGPKRYIRIVVHDTTGDLQSAAKRHRSGADFSNAGGCFHPPLRRERYRDGEWHTTADPHWAGVLRLSREMLSSEVVAHECVHAGLAIYRMDVAADAELGDDCGPREETLAYIVGDLTAQVTNALHDAGAWS